MHMLLIWVRSYYFPLKENNFGFTTFSFAF